jgi:putative endopeptidase
MKTIFLGTAAAAALLAACPAASQTSAPGSDLTKAQRLGSWGYDLSARDPSVTAGQDFFLYANGSYLKTLQIPADRTRFGAFDVLNELSQNRMRAVVEKAAADKAATGERAKVGALYRSFLDEAKVDALGAKPLQPELARIKAQKSKTEVARHMGATTGAFGGSIFSAAIAEDAKDPDHYAVYLGQAGLGMPDRDYYLEPQFAAQKAKYEQYVARQLTLAHWPKPAEAAKAIVALETEIAKVSWTRAERRDDEKMYNATAVADLPKLAPGFDWAAYLSGAKLGKTTKVVVGEKTAFPKIADLFAKAPLETLKAWEAFTLVDQASPYLSKAFDEAHFDFHNKTLGGQQAQQPRWKRGVQLVDNQIGEALGKLYVADYFPAESKAKMLGLVGDIRTAMRARIEKLDWMSPATKAKAFEKLDSLRVKIGYPDKWRDYSGLTIKDGDLYGNVERASAFDWAFRVGRLGGPVDKSEWGMTPPTINAYYNPTGNEIVFPAAILQPPFFDPDGDMAINYGGIGGVIGHELTHGFDDQGRRYDAHGRLTDWWTPEDAKRFQAEATKLGAEYGAFEVLPGAKINGDLTMGENIADLGGLLLALDAYHASLKGKPAPIIDGLTGDQRVFLGWAQVWRGKTRDDRLRQQLVSDPHSPNQARVDVPVRNIDAFYEAFGVKPGDKMYVAPGDRVRIW